MRRLRSIAILFPMKSFSRGLPVILLASLLTLAGCLSPSLKAPSVSGGDAPSTAPVSLAAGDAVPPDPRVIRGTLDNGLTYYVRSNGKPEKRAELRLVVNAGSLQEEDDQQGLAHFLEHMEFNGTEGFPKQKIVDYLESIGMSFGADLNAYTSFDETVYKLQVPTDVPADLETGVRILEEWAHRITIDPAEVDRERPVIVEEWRLRRGAEARMRDMQYPIMFQGSRYALRQPIGRMPVVETARAEDLRRFYTDWYRPDLMAVVAVGDFDAAAVEKMIRERFSGIPRREDPRPREAYPVPDTPGTLYAPATDPEATATRVALYVKQAVSPMRSVGDYRRAIVRELYSAMLDSRLEELSRAPGSAIQNGATGWGRVVRSKDMYILTARVREDRIADALTLLITESERVRQHGFTATELEREKKNIAAQIEKYYRDRDNQESDAVLQAYVDNFLQGDPMPDVETEHALYSRFLPEITLEEVNGLSAGLLTEDNRVVLVNAPRSQAAAVPGEMQVAGIFRAAAAAAATPYTDSVAGQPLFSARLAGGRIVERTVIPELGLTQWRLSNGAVVMLKPTDFKKDEVLFSAFGPGGTSLVPDADLVPAMTAAGLVAESGLGSLDATQLRKTLAGKTASVSPWIGELQQGLRGSARPEDLETLLQLAYLTVTAPRADERAFTLYRQRLKTSLENRKTSPQAVFYDTLQDVLAQNKPRGSSWGPERADQMDLRRSLDVYADRFADAGSFRFLFVGSVTATQVEPLVVKYIGSLPSAGRGEKWKDTGIVPPGGVVTREVRKGLEPQSRVQIVFTGQTPWSLENRLLVDALGRVLDIRIREAVRENAGGSYDAGADGQLDRFPREEYLVSVDFGCAPPNVEALAAVAMREADRLGTEGPSEEDVLKVKEMLRREHEQNLTQNQYWLGSLQMFATYELDPRLILGFDQRLAAVSRDALRQKARELLRPDRCIRLILLPEAAR
jgi:zinc protease